MMRELNTSRSACLLIAILLSSFATVALGQALHISGQGVQPIYEGFERNDDGSFTLWFGYLNRNYEELPVVAVGENNRFEVADGVTIAGPLDPELVLSDPGPRDRGQPGFFYPRRQQFVFGVEVPEDFVGKELVWTLSHNGETNTAIGTLERSTSWSVDEGVWNANRGRGTSGRTGVALSNQVPAIRIVGVEGQINTSVGAATALRVMAQDDGLPGALENPRRRAKLPPLPNDLPVIGGELGRNGPKEQQVVHYAAADKTGLAVTWVKYRGAGDVVFDELVLAVDPQGEEASTVARFSQAGTYELRAYADDGTYLRSASVTVVVR